MQVENIFKELSDPNISAGLVALILVFIGWRIIHRIKEESPLEPYILQILGLLFILPVVMLMSIALDLGKEAVTGIIGMIVGYIFGTSRPLYKKQSEATASNSQKSIESNGAMNADEYKMDSKKANTPELKSDMTEIEEFN